MGKVRIEYISKKGTNCVLITQFKIAVEFIYLLEKRGAKIKKVEVA